MAQVDEFLLTINDRLDHFFERRGCAHDSRDLTHETIRRVLEKKVLGDQSDEERSRIVFGFAHNVLKEWNRQRGRAPSLDTETPEPVDRQPLAEQQVIHRQLLTMCSQKLKPAERSLLQLYLDDEPSSEVAARLGISLNALRFRTFKIREKLRECLNQAQRAPLIRIHPLPSPRKTI